MKYPVAMFFNAVIGGERVLNFGIDPDSPVVYGYTPERDLPNLEKALKEWAAQHPISGIRVIQFRVTNAENVCLAKEMLDHMS